MIEIEVALYLISEKRTALLEKRIQLPVVPRVGECIKFRNAQLGDYFTFNVEQVTHRESGIPEIWATTRQITELKIKESPWDDGELDGDIATYVNEGWKLKTCHRKRGKDFQPDAAAKQSQPVWPETNSKSTAAGSGR